MCGVMTSADIRNTPFKGKYKRSEEILLLVLLASITVSCQQVIRAQVGDSVLLPCDYRTDPLPETTTVFWRDNNNSVVLNIIKKKPDNNLQDEKYKGRVFSFQNVYNEGNFSILMKDVRLTDSSLYECLILEVNHLQILQLTVSERRAGAADTSPHGAAGGAVVTSTSLLVSLLLLSLTSVH
ncbi:CD276 antigen homolog [Labrus mixtus]|uniref:CD276 antigen homolog n=1 Tax=Labrus mixtus TaxID=508554 RepID=UPI0029BFF60A|nr:CD276 antigen homolog [Labrus mixtus]